MIRNLIAAVVGCLYVAGSIWIVQKRRAGRTAPACNKRNARAREIDPSTRLARREETGQGRPVGRRREIATPLDRNRRSPTPAPPPVVERSRQTGRRSSRADPAGDRARQGEACDLAAEEKGGCSSRRQSRAGQSARERCVLEPTSTDKSLGRRLSQAR